MPSIIIREKDLTTSGLSADVTDIAYVPGFGDATITTTTTNKPVLLTSLAMLQSYFGTAPMAFTADYTMSSESGWAANSYSATDAKMFETGDFDPAYIYAAQLLSSGMPVYYERINSANTTIDAADMYTALVGVAAVGQTAGTPSILEKLKDRGTYTIKYITTGGYPIFENTSTGYGGLTIVETIFSVAAATTSEDSSATVTGRGDCIALIDHTNYPGRPLTGATSVFGLANTTGVTNPFNSLGTQLTFGAMFTPWINYAVNGVSGVVSCDLPGSFAYLANVAEATLTYGSWYAIAGVTRGTVSNVNTILTTQMLTNNIANIYQKDVETGTGVSINAITEVKPYGQVIWGNRTLQNADESTHVTATGFLNIRNMLCDIKKRVYIAARRYMFEQNSDILWINFKSMITPLLDKMLTGYGLSNYVITKGAASGKTKLYANITLYPIYAVEAFTIDIELQNDDVSVTE